ncbi:MAG: AAA family ATPase [Defluviitaleaceae bacterium]|nr:AAA family ATPase [Defluviitaleaceae bacterium]
MVFSNGYHKDILLKFEGKFIQQIAPLGEQTHNSKPQLVYYAIDGELHVVDGKFLCNVKLDNNTTTVNLEGLKEKDTNPPLEIQTVTLNDLVGLKEVKEKFKEFESLSKYFKKLLEEESAEEVGEEDIKEDYVVTKHKEMLGFSAKNKKPTVDVGSFHMVFKGNPGTGKTTVAERVHNLLKSCDLIVKKDKPTIVTKQHLVGRYVGHTEALVEKVVQESLGGVLFIDEAYMLYQDSNSGNDFGKVALDLIMDAMERYRDQLVVILAGYTDEMDKLINESNPGLKSRIKFHFEFKDYTDSELWAIFDTIVRNKGYKLEDDGWDTYDILEKYFKTITNAKEFGNARGVRNLFEDIRLAVAVRTMAEDSPSNLRMIMIKDVEKVCGIKKDEV